MVTPHALAYARSLEARQHNPPVAGGPLPPIPRLDFENPLLPPTGAPRTPPLPPQAPPKASMPVPGGLGPAAAGPASSIFGPSAAPGTKVDYAAQGIQNDDMLTPEACKDPSYVQGFGAGFAVNQPALAYKYGVLRRGSFIPAQALRGPTPAADAADKAAQFQALINAQARSVQDKAEQERRAREAKEEQGTVGVAAPPATAADKPAAPAKALPMLDNFDIDTMRQLMNKDLLNNDEQRNIIEARLKPMSLTDLIIQGYVRQLVPIHPGTLEYEYQSLPSSLRVDLKRLVTIEARKLDVTDDYLIDRHTILEIVCGIYAINGQVLPDYRDAEGNFSEEALNRKYAMVARMNNHLISSLGVNQIWFEARVRKLFVVEAVKNG